MAGGGHEVERVDVGDVNLGGCLGCYKCQAKPDEPGCVQKDDGNELFDRLIAADALLLAAPMYCWSFPAQLKPLIDRTVCLVSGYMTANYKSLVEQKPLGLLSTCAGPIEGNADVLQQQFVRYAAFGKTKMIDPVVIPFCTTPENLGIEARDKAKILAAGLVSG